MISVNQTDIVIRGPDYQLVAVVEVKNRQELTSDIAEVIRRNILSHGLRPPAPYFLLISQDVGFLWRQLPDNPLEGKLILEFPLHNVIHRYLPGMPSGDRLTGTLLETVLFQWLTSLTWLKSENITEEPERSLAAVGFLDVIREATISKETQPAYARLR